jgi:glycosyltransferase involved in cell wall biosynthesis
MASHGEGFGLPLVEAAVQGRHVLARDLAVFREQNLPNVQYFEDDHPEALGQALMELVQAKSLSANAQLGLPTWSDSVDDLLEKLGISQVGTPGSSHRGLLNEHR